MATFVSITRVSTSVIPNCLLPGGQALVNGLDGTIMFLCVLVDSALSLPMITYDFLLGFQSLVELIDLFVATPTPPTNLTDGDVLIVLDTEFRPAECPSKLLLELAQFPVEVISEQVAAGCLPSVELTAHLRVRFFRERIDQLPQVLAKGLVVDIGRTRLVLQNICSDRVSNSVS